MKTEAQRPGVQNKVTRLDQDTPAPASTSYPENGSASTCVNYQEMSDQAAQLPRLFTASVTVDRYEWLDRCRIQLFVDGRQEEIAPYEALLEGYHDGFLTERHDREARIDQLFTEQEVGAIAGYLKAAYGWEVELQEVPLPVPISYHLPAGALDLNVRPDDSCFDWKDFSSEEGYSLPFVALGQWEPDDCLPSLDLSEEAESLGIDFITRALIGLGAKMAVVGDHIEIFEAPAELKPDDLVRILHEIHAQSDLYVTRHSKPRKFREIERDEAEKRLAAQGTAYRSVDVG